MSDFIREVDEDYRRERLLAFLRRYQLALVGAAVLIIAGAGGYRWFRDHQRSQAEAADARYQQAGREAGDGKLAEAEAGFAALASGEPAGYALLARLRGAEADTDPEAAAKRLDVIASDDAAGSPALRDLARFRGALLRVDRDDPKAFDARYGRFAQDTFTFHDGMRELLALAALKRGDGAAAEKYLEAVIADPLSPPALRNRAQALRELTSGGPATPVDKQPGPAKVTPLGGPAPAAQFDTIAPVETLPAPVAPDPTQASAAKPGVSDPGAPATPGADDKSVPPASPAR